jgi:hypothetical protein
MFKVDKFGLHLVEIETIIKHRGAGGSITHPWSPINTACLICHFC